MKLLLTLLCLTVFSVKSQYSDDFQLAYENNANLPSGILEAVSWTRTRMQVLDENGQASCAGLPKAVGILGLFEDGGNYFIENAKVVETLSGISLADQKSNPSQQLLAYATAFNQLYSQRIAAGHSEANAVYLTLLSLSEIPDVGSVNSYAKDVQVFEIMRFMNQSDFAATHGFTVKHYPLASVFGQDNYAVLSASKVVISDEHIANSSGTTYAISTLKSTEYGPAIWNPAPPCNLSSRNGIAISAITIHTIQGSYAGAISWSQNCDSNVSFHYVIRSSDGQVTQMVVEADKAWHVGSENPYTIGYEHEGYVDNPVWYTEAMYASSADLSRDIVNSGYGIPPLRTFFGTATAGINTLGGCTKIKGHQHYPNQSHTDPGINWNWEKYYKLINNAPTITTLTNPSDPFFDSGGAAGNYQDDERNLWLIAPPAAGTVTLNFTAFQLELNYDYLFLYDGSTLDAPLIGRYTGTNTPGSITSTGGSLLVEFRSDCATTAPGWQANYTSTTTVNELPVTVISNSGSWKTSNFDALISDTDEESEIEGRYYLVADKTMTSNDWQSNLSSGFVYENFADNSSNWTAQQGDFEVTSNRYVQSDVVNGNTNAYLMVEQLEELDYLYEWNQRFTSNELNQRAGIHFMCSDPTLSNRGNSYFVYLRETSDQVQIYSVDNDVFSLESNVDLSIESNVDYAVKVTYSPQTGWINVYVNDLFVSSWQDLTPLTSGNSISLRTGNCAVEFDDIQVYQSRHSLVSISLGENGMMRYESENAIETGMLKAVSLDATNQWSAPAMETYLIDRSAPLFSLVADGVGVDIDTTNSTTLEGSWDSEDIHSGVALFEFALGTSSGSTDVLDWTANGLSAMMSHVLVAPIYNQVYYISVRATNGAGLYSSSSSDGQLILSPDAGIDVSFLENIVIYPNPSSEVVYFTNVEEPFTAVLMDMNGKEVLRKEISVTENSLSISNVAHGSYSLVLQVNGGFQVRQLVKN